MWMVLVFTFLSWQLTALCYGILLRYPLDMVLGLERLKLELQARGLKCGGTLEERAVRLFLLKTTPLDKLPKKLLAKRKD
ncbi:hypothetical protein AMTR_s00021p00050080 [Amborella trichopoda]|uniref:SDE2/SF3A3 SAP domain-containing protein n=1 Tax=Amborella trichopoda TaxID=13333 RepID=W1Q0F5_AMBTC|nr:hypothetical protein AMTR_s00021p00050080 [Amborella trichopoda]